MTEKSNGFPENPAAPGGAPAEAAGLRVEEASLLGLLFSDELDLSSVVQESRNQI